MSNTAGSRPLAVVDEGLAMATATLQAFHEIELNRLRGELLTAKGATHREEAERCLRRAIDLARKQEARSYELRRDRPRPNDGGCRPEG